jgi:hypothetical protein
MRSLFDSLVSDVAATVGSLWKQRAPPRQTASRQTSNRKPASQPPTSRVYRCQCEQPVFFRNDACTTCHTALGFEPTQLALLALRAGAAPDTPAGLPPGTPSSIWHLHDDADQPPAAYGRCANHSSAACNWLVPLPEAPAATGQPAQQLCVACRLNRTIPDLGLADNPQLWRKIEEAKRRLVYQLLALKLPVVSQEFDDAQTGLAFDFLRNPPDGPRVLTGHANGVITLNIEEADDATRERTRHALREPYRTLLGHLRHEVGHYYWDRLVYNTPWLPQFRQLFGDEQQSYSDALRANYEQGPPADWAERHVSSYASSHPWEDWAETWAHYLHMMDTLDTALRFGLDADDVELDSQRFGPDALWQPHAKGAKEFLGFVNAWVELTGVLNELSRSMGQPDFYPFVLARPVVAKLQFVHAVVTGFKPQA